MSPGDGAAAGAGAGAGAPGAARAAGSGGRWWERPLRIIQLNLTVPDAAGDGAQLARSAHAYGANALLLNAGGIYAFYPTDVPYHRRAPGLASDLLGDAVRAGAANGLRVIVRYDLSGLHRDAYEAHPEWFYRSADGRPMVDKGLYTTCPNAGWWQRGFFALWDELGGRYAVDGLFFNAWGHKEVTREGVTFGPCHCAACLELFRERYGRPPPSGRDPADPAYRLNAEFRRQTLDDLGRRIYRYVKDRDPEVAVFAGAGQRALASGQADCTEIELHCGSTASLTGARWRHAAGESCKQVAALGPGFASGINAVYGHVGPGRWRLSAAPAGWLGYVLAQTLANAGWPYCMLIGTLDSQPDRSALPVLRDLLHFARDHEADYRDLESVAGVGLVWSQRPAPAPAGRPEPGARRVLAFRGWYDLLTRRHRLFDVLPDTLLEGPDAPDAARPQALDGAALGRRYGLLILPGAAGLSTAACETLDDFVARGGRLIVTGAAPLAAGAGAGLTCLGAAALVASRERVSNAYFRLRPADREGRWGLPGLGDVDLLPAEGRLWYVSLRQGAVPGLALVPPEDYGAPEQTVFTLETEHPGVVWHRHGEGLTAYLPWEPDRVWLETGSEALGALLDALVQRSLLPTTADVGASGSAPPASSAASRSAGEVEVTAPEAVELTAHRQRPTGRLLVHLVNGSGGAPPRWASPAPLHDLALRFRWGGAAPRVRAARAGADLPPRRVDGGYEVTLPRLDLFELIAVEPAP